MKKSFLFKTMFFCFLSCLLFASDIVIEILVTDADNKLWQTKNQMHMTIGHIKGVEREKCEKLIERFNKENGDLLKSSISKGFVVESFNTDGFGNGYHILDADPETTARFSLINSKLYDFLIEHHCGALTDKTTPKRINPKGYTPHIEFLETSSEKVPGKGTVIHFKDWHFQGRILK